MSRKSMGTIYHSGDYSDKQPDWYWVQGLHDSKIINAQYYELDYDYKRKKVNKNTLCLDIDSSSALSDTTVKSISFINCKFNSNVDLSGCIWFADKLFFENEKYRLALTFTDCEREDTVNIIFDIASVEHE
ncbi:hypothetical protein SDC9_138319 [bioreactor metagenome]|uniref:Uncharacterized protein n=1 Tax=bioreactor metagenome TaxID=1076179 RepID=A0A645DRV8_9ZZZZ